MADRYEINTLADIIATYVALPAERGELFLKEIGDAVRSMASLDGFASLNGPLVWINDDKGVGTMKLRAEADGPPLVTATFDLNRRGS